MPGKHVVVRALNRQFDDDNIQTFARNADRFAPGHPLDVGLLNFHDKSIARQFQAYIEKFPAGLRETIRALISYALSASPPIPMSFSWAPGYDYEVTVFQPECGILVQIRSPIPRET